MGRCLALTRVDLTRRPQALGRLRLIFGLPAHLHVLCSIWAFLIRPKQNHKSGGADAVRMQNSSNPPQSGEVIDCMPQPSTWHDAWELSWNLSQHPYLLSPLLLHLFYHAVFWVWKIWHHSTSSSFNIVVLQRGRGTHGIHIIAIYHSCLNLSRSQPCMLHKTSHTAQTISNPVSWHYRMPSCSLTAPC